MALCAKGYVCALAGELPEATAAVRQMLERLSDSPDVVLERMGTSVLGRAALSAGDLAEADRQFTRTDDIEGLLNNREPATNRFHADHAEAVIGLRHHDRAERLVRRMEARAAALPRP